MGDTLQVGGELGLGQALEGGAYTLTLQNDGNLVLSEPEGTVVWATMTHEQGVERAVLQDDGNFVLYSAAGPVWATDTNGGEADHLVVQPDRNIVLYGRNGASLWASGTNTDNPIVVAEPVVGEEPLAAPAAEMSPPPAPQVRTYTVEPGDTLWTIAERFYGDGNRYLEIAGASGIENPDAIDAGQLLTIP
ncbi:LysM peptidoglycan-binding domain-containing protein [Nocardia sp. NPDC052254]|uniref:LysM peptidoglycan-binding domain-containing protein n=1 Tax=Nocardia sp. NPDC052254 TaxID=3155681 RepID=UPI0034248877